MKNSHFLLGVSWNHLSTCNLMVFQGPRLAFHGSRWIFMVFQGSKLVFIVPGWFLWSFKVSGWFFMFPSGFSWFFKVPVFHDSTWNLRCKIFGLKIRRFKILDKSHVWYAGPRPQFIPNGFKANNGHPPGRHSNHWYDHQHHHRHHQDHQKQGYSDHHHQECTSPVSLTLNIGLSAMKTS